MRVLGVVGMLAAAAIVLVLMVIVGRSVADAGGGAEPKTGAQKAYDEMKNDPEAPLDDPKEEMRGVLRDLR